MFKRYALDWLKTNIGDETSYMGGSFPGPGSLLNHYDAWLENQPKLAAEYERLTGDANSYRMTYRINKGYGWAYIVTCEDDIGRKMPWVTTILIDDDYQAIQFKLAT
jgi:hypothetical protein